MKVESILDEYLIPDKEFYDALRIVNMHKFIAKMRKDRYLVDVVCDCLNLKLLGIDFTLENTTDKEYTQEPVYILSDNIGHYTSQGLKNTLECYCEEKFK